MDSEVKIAALLMMGVVGVVMCLCLVGFAVHYGNVQVATACVKSGGEWMDPNARHGSDTSMQCIRR